jgi:hypothetical protein
VDYSLFMAVSMVLMLERLEKRPEVTPAAFSPPIFPGIAPVSIFLCHLLSGTPRGGLYIGVFRPS